MIQLSLKQILTEQFSVNITAAQCNQMIQTCLRYEIRGENMPALNSPYLGIHKAYFLGKDSDSVFDIFGIYKIEFNKAIKKCSSISSQWNVTGNDFNILVIWLVYLLGKATTINKTITPQLALNTKMALLKMLHYKFFTGKVTTMFKHGVNEGVMEYTINNISAKSDIKKEGTDTWRLLIEDHVKQVLAPGSIHAQTFETFQPDKNIIYVLSDMHTRLSAKIKNIAEEYYKNHAAGNSTKSTSLMSQNDDGEKVLGDLKTTLDTIIIQIQNLVLNTNTFINFQHVRLAASIANLRPELLRDTLIAFSNLATVQYKNHLGNEIKTNNKETIYTGYCVLIYELIQKSYRRCAQMGCDMKSNIQILQKTRDAYRASRILDPGILSVKNSVDYFITEYVKISRESVAVSTRTAFILYMIILSFNKS